MIFKRSLLPSLLICCLVATAVAQQPDVSIGNIDIHNLKWGKQRAAFDVTNNTDWFHWVTVLTDISFEGTYLNPHRVTRQHYALNPGETKTIRPKIIVPPNYGKALVKVSVYDVLDTLDVLMEENKLFEQPFQLRFKPTDEVWPYLKERVTMPPMVENGPRFDNEFSHILPFMLQDGKTLAEIAAMTETDTLFVMDVIHDLIRGKDIIQDSIGLRLAFPVITHEEAMAAKEISNRLVDTLVPLITRNLKYYALTLDSLVTAGVMSADTNDFLNGGTVLLHRYPVVAGLLLWSDLGQRFISASRRPLAIYANTDPCKANIPEYMYAVAGGPALNGHHYYSLTVSPSSIEIDFADTIPSISCPENPFVRSILRERREWKYTPESQPESFIFDQKLAETAVRSMERGVVAPMKAAITELADLAKTYHHGPGLQEGYRLWFWNLTATRTVRQLVKSGVLARRGNGHYQFVSKR